ncbi:RelA/SpoT family protein [Natranaerobius thermophilus]|uniref:RelA/SpoT family protein n=1 Tax=Natranaerobius thermophilus TaxID=375929 RepID=UPI0001666A6D|nr:bifunctional (p)ppGpp synthetase/guanosine-3',5'-bis(diphosphate) 3'-pyrophosphohydrolase [Natranaerobius thermophilus]
MKTLLDAEQLFFSLKEKIKSYYPLDTDLEQLDRAFEFARSYHNDQKRVSGEEYIVHPIEVALVLADLELDLDTISAGLLHDVMEDTPATREELEELFGDEITLLVDGVTKLSRLNFKTKEEHQAENLRKMFFAMANDIRVILIKLADRTHNMRTLNYLPERKQKEIAKETMEIYAPLANRLGIYKIKWELEDLAFRYIEPEQYYYLADRIVQKRMEREEYIKKIKVDLRDKLKEMGIDGEIHGRPKHLYSIYSKMKKTGKDLNEIYDLIALRIIVNNVKDCYAVLGTVHTMWKPVPGRFKDYIAVPKSNMYQSLHTTVLCPQGNLVEIQIRTWDMHKTAEYGIAAHWKYKENTDDKKFAEKVSWFRQLLEWQQETSDALEFMEHLKVDLFSDEVFVFTPKGDVIDLPSGSTPIDFAYRIHTDIGNTCIGAKISGRMVSLDYQLQTGDVVEILTSKHATPSRDWLNLVKSSQAKNKIKQWFKRQSRDENIQRGREMIEREAKRLKIFPEKYIKDEQVQEEVAEKFNMKSYDDVLAALGYGGITVNQVIGKYQSIYKANREELEEEEDQVEDFSKYLKEDQSLKKTKDSISVQGLENIATRFAKCCHPLPGEHIVGFITRTRGITIHRHDCPNAQHKLKNNERTVPVHWDESGDNDFQVSVSVFAVDRQRIVQDIMKALGDSKIAVTAIEAKTDKNQVAKINLTVLIKNHSHLQFVIDKLQNIQDVLKVQRDNP